MGFRSWGCWDFGSVEYFSTAKAEMALKPSFHDASLLWALLVGSFQASDLISIVRLQNNILVRRVPSDVKWPWPSGSGVQTCRSLLWCLAACSYIGFTYRHNVPCLKNAGTQICPTCQQRNLRHAGFRF